jgi:hypothetical protein
MTNRQPKEGIYRGERTEWLGQTAVLRNVKGSGKLSAQFKDDAALKQLGWVELQLSDFTITRWGK